MQQRTFNYSLKNIPLPPVKNYKKRLIRSVEDDIKRMRWKAICYNKDREDTNKTNKFGLRSKKCPPPVKDMESFESELLDMARNVKIKKGKQRIPENPKKRPKIRTKL
jgi:hypothetical protein